MANVNDTNNTLGKLENQWENLREADIDDRDRTAIEEFVRLQRKSDCEPNTLISDLSVLRCAAERADTSLVDMDKGDLRQLFRVLTAPTDQGGYGLDPSGSGMFGYKRGLRNFFQWLNDQPDYDDFGFAETIELPKQEIDRVNEDDLLDEEEVEKLKNVANNPRDAALIDFLADTAARISLASQLRVRDIHELDTDRPYYTPNPNGVGHKGAPDKRYPILYSRAELRTYVNHHHPDPRPEAPLWAVLRGYDPENPEGSAVSGDRIRDMLRECKRRADIDKRVTPHTFRHTCITRLSKTGYTPKEIQHIAGWADDRMLEAYDHTTDQERNEQLRVRAGLVDEPESTTTPSTPKTCGNCRETLGPTAKFCPNCGTATTEKARTAKEAQEERFFESATKADGELAEAVLQFRRLTNQYPVLRAAVLED